PTDLADVLQRLADAYGDGDFRIHWQLPAMFPSLDMPEGALDAVLSTFITNSRLAGANEIRLLACEQQDRITLTIADNGSGIAPADREQIFEPFFTTHREAGGSGLGLSIARSLVIASGGTLELKDSEEGTTFVIEIPIAAPSAVS
ncbi:HAMP domain-containing histidine kinase, partial [Sphingomonadaceae bacterium]|nr:HAMP domain-containing histidine kinase [Sphingomonadaceae bacterium]